MLCVGTEKGVVEIRKVVIGDEEEAKGEQAGVGDKAVDAEKPTGETVVSDRRLAAGTAKPDFEEMIPVGGATLEVVATLVGHTNR
jgi:protein MAK11